MDWTLNLYKVVCLYFGFVPLFLQCSCLSKTVSIVLCCGVMCNMSEGLQLGKKDHNLTSDL